MTISDQKRTLEGSAARDRFKRLHKEQLPDNCYALDLDFVLVEKNSHPDGVDPLIVAVLDFKQDGDTLTFTEVLTYNELINDGIPVYIVKTQTSSFVDKTVNEHRFDVVQYLAGDWRTFPPETSCETVRSGLDWSEFATWQSELRVRRRREVRE